MHPHAPPPVFSDQFVDDFAGTDFDPKRINYRLSIEVFDMGIRNLVWG